MILQVSQFILQQQQLIIAAKADTIAQKGYEVAKYRFISGKTGITDLNLTAKEKDLAKKNYISALWKYWSNYYNIRRVTLYDFEKGKSLYGE